MTFGQHSALCGFTQAAAACRRRCPAPRCPIRGGEGGEAWPGGHHLGTLGEELARDLAGPRVLGVVKAVGD